MREKEKNGVVYLKFNNLSPEKAIKHGFTTRIGGCSAPPYDTMNLAYHMGDDKETVDKNYAYIKTAMDITDHTIKMTTQIHKGNVYSITEENDTIPEGIDGLVTDLTGITLTTYFADCVPILFFDPEKKVIGNAHSGWRGTLEEIGVNVVKEMIKSYGCDKNNILVGIGPCISQKNFEVGAEVEHAFTTRYPWSKDFITAGTGDKWYLDLKGIIKYQLEQIGINSQNIEISDLCTYENKQLFFSHRRDGNQRGNMVAMIGLVSHNECYSKKST